MVLLEILGLIIRLAVILFFIALAVGFCVNTYDAWDDSYMWKDKD